MLRPNCWDEVGTENAILAERSIEIVPSTARPPAIPADGVGMRKVRTTGTPRTARLGIPLAPVSLRVMGRSFCSDLPVFDGRRSAVMAFRARYSEVVTRGSGRGPEPPPCAASTGP